LSKKIWWCERDFNECIVLINGCSLCLEEIGLSPVHNWFQCSFNDASNSWCFAHL
jgi:hypothetical protein